jgi:hypothetical protein
MLTNVLYDGHHIIATARSGRDHPFMHGWPSRGAWSPAEPSTSVHRPRALFIGKLGLTDGYCVRRWLAAVAGWLT